MWLQPLPQGSKEADMTTGNRLSREAICGSVPAVVWLVAATLHPDLVFAQESPALRAAVGLEEVIVTAQRAAQDLQIVPISIEALTRRDIESARLDDLRSLDRVSPSITGGQSVRALGGRIGIRGFNDLDRNAGGERSVGIYVDGVYSGRKDALTEPTVGIERIEVLRGPQGTLFGRNSTAGALSLTTRKPTDHPELSLALDVGNYSTTDVEGWVGGPVRGKTLTGSLSVGFHDDDGYVENVTLGNRQASYRTLSGRGFLRWSPSERLSVDLALDGLEDDGEGYNG
jgi:iron complex outermembrane receptor protein